MEGIGSPKPERLKVCSGNTEQRGLEERQTHIWRMSEKRLGKQVKGSSDRILNIKRRSLSFILKSVKIWGSRDGCNHEFSNKINPIYLEEKEPAGEETGQNFIALIQENHLEAKGMEI